MTLCESTLLSAWVEVVGNWESGVRGDGGKLGLHAFRVMVWMGGKSGRDVDVVGVGCVARCSRSVPSMVIHSPSSCCAVLKFMFHSVVTLHVVVKYTWCTCDSVSKLSQQPSRVHVSNFVLLVLCTYTVVPHGCRADRSGAHPNNAWYSVRPLRAQVAVRFLSHVS